MAVLVLVGGISYFPARSEAANKPTVFIQGSSVDGGSTTAETAGIFARACPAVIVTIDKDHADFVLVRDDNGGGIARNPQKVNVYDSAKKLIYSGATKTISGAAKAACKAMGASKI